MREIRAFRYFWPNRSQKREFLRRHAETEKSEAKVA
jgi:hypothetical protein